MGDLITKNALGIFWNGEEVNGFTAYGYWSRTNVPEPTFPSGVWPGETEYKSQMLRGTQWSVWLWDIRIPRWPDQDRWPDAVLATLRAFRDSGAKLAWFGLEGIFADPPSLFSPVHMSGGVWAALGRENIMHGPPALDRDFVVLSDTELVELRKESGLLP